MNAAIEATAVGVRVGAKRLIDDISLRCEAGETIALVGPNGAGKSTLLRALSGEIGTASGEIRIKGRAPRDYGPRLLALQRAVLSQSTTVAFPFTVAEVVAMGAGERRGPRVDAMVDEALAEVDLTGFRDRIIGTLSGGEQQRAHFARVMIQLACGEAACGPGLLLLDEPTASLDLRHQLDIVAAAKRRAERGVCVVAVLHDLNLAALFAQRIVVLDRGRLAADGTPERTITADNLERIFGVASAVGLTPEPDAPFVLPHRARKA